MPSVRPVSGRVGVWWRMVKAGGVTKARTGPNWADASFSWGRRRWDRGVTSRQGLSETVPYTTPTQMFLFQHPAAQFSLSPSLTLCLALSLSSPPLFFSLQNALLTKRFTNLGWYIIHDRLLWDWFKQMDSEREGGRGGGLHGKDGKGESEKGCVPHCSSFTKPPHGPRWIFPFLCILRSHTLNTHYTAFICKRRHRLCEGRAAEDGLWSPCICMHGASLEAFWHVWHHHEWEIWLS